MKHVSTQIEVGAMPEGSLKGVYELCSHFFQTLLRATNELMERKKRGEPVKKSEIRETISDVFVGAAEKTFRFSAEGRISDFQGYNMMRLMESIMRLFYRFLIEILVKEDW